MSKENLHFDVQHKQVVFLLFIMVFPCSYRFKETQVKVWDNMKGCGDTCLLAHVPTAFLVVPNFHLCSY